MAVHNNLGKWGEEYAAEYLLKNGYEIISRDWKLGKRDIDIVARTEDGMTVVFVEVKTRATDVVSCPEDAIDERKIMSIGWTANAYVKEFQIYDDLRFDIISIVGTKPEDASIEHIVDAFNPLLATNGRR
jgi:putative endonuclease